MMALIEVIVSLVIIAKDQARRLNKIVALVRGLRIAIENGDKTRIARLLDKISRTAAGEAKENSSP